MLRIQCLMSVWLKRHKSATSSTATAYRRSNACFRARRIRTNCNLVSVWLPRNKMTSVKTDGLNEDNKGKEAYPEHNTYAKARVATIWYISDIVNLRIDSIDEIGFAVPEQSIRKLCDRLDLRLENIRYKQTWHRFVHILEGPANGFWFEYTPSKTR